MGQNLLNRFGTLSLDNAKFNNRLAFLINFASVLILVFCLLHYIARNWFTVNRIIIEGDIYHVTPVQLTYIAQNRLHGTFFTLDIAGLKSAFQEIPWVRQVSVKRHFPHTIIVNVEEYKAIARIGDDDMLAENGDVFDGADNDNSSLPVFYVSSSRAALALEKYKQIQSILIRHDDSLSKLWLTSPLITQFTTKNNLQVEICSTDFNNSLIKIDKYWDKLYKINPKLNSINLCYKNAIAINYESSIFVKKQSESAIKKVH